MYKEAFWWLEGLWVSTISKSTIRRFRQFINKIVLPTFCHFSSSFQETRITHPIKAELNSFGLANFCWVGLSHPSGCICTTCILWGCRSCNFGTCRTSKFVPPRSFPMGAGIFLFFIVTKSFTMVVKSVGGWSCSFT